jgi:hypothetical protein
VSIMRVLRCVQVRVALNHLQSLLYTVKDFYSVVLFSSSKGPFRQIEVPIEAIHRSCVHPFQIHVKTCRSAVSHASSISASLTLLTELQEVQYPMRWNALGLGASCTARSTMP